MLKPIILRTPGVLNLGQWDCEKTNADPTPGWVSTLPGFSASTLWLDQQRRTSSHWYPMVSLSYQWVVVSLYRSAFMGLKDLKRKMETERVDLCMVSGCFRMDWMRQSSLVCGFKMFRVLSIFRDIFREPGARFHRCGCIAGRADSSRRKGGHHLLENMVPVPFLCCCWWGVLLDIANIILILMTLMAMAMIMMTTIMMTLMVMMAIMMILYDTLWYC